MKWFFSRPMPCSPESAPPDSMATLRISALALVLAQRDDRRRRAPGLLAESLDLDEEHRTCVLGEVDVEGRVHRTDRRAIEHLHGRRHDAARDDRACRARAGADVRELREE